MPSRETRWWRHHEAAKTMRQMRKQIKRNRKPDRVRNRDWMPEACDDLRELDELDAWDESSSPQSERVMPRGEQERRKATLRTALTAVEEGEPEEPAPTGALSGQRGMVVEVSSGLCRVDLGMYELLCTVRGSLQAAESGLTNVLAVGDKVWVEPDGAGRGTVQAVLPRRSALTRPDVFLHHLQQVIVANAEQLLIVTSWREPAIWFELVDRYLITAERNRLSPCICVNKIDLAEDSALCRQALRPYVELGYHVIFACALTGKGVDELRQMLRGRITVLAGLSGVGKSSLLAAVQPGLRLRTAEISARHHEGRHTTSQVTMLKLQMGGFVVDTPGIREFGLNGLRRGDLASFYPEIVAVATGCRFANCSHTLEPDCAVKAAVSQGQVSATRYHSYQKIYAELPA